MTEQLARQELNDRNGTIGQDTAAEMARKGRKGYEPHVTPHKPKRPGHAERWKKARRQIGWWLNWGMIATGHDIESVRVGPEGAKVQCLTGEARTWLVTWAESCHDACEDARLRCPREARPTEALLLRLFGSFSYAMATKEFVATPLQRRAEVLALIEGMEEPDPPKIAGTCWAEQLEEMTTEVNARIDDKYSGKLLLSRPFSSV